MRALVGALVGLVVGAAIVGALDVAMNSKAFWSVLVAGLAAGVSMRSLAGGGGGSYAKGALAAIATALAAIGGPIAATQWFSSISKATPTAVVANQSASDGEEADEGPAVSAPEVPVVLESEAPNPLSTVQLKRPTASDTTVRDTICLVLGCLLAYQMGKGEAAKRASEVDEAAEGEAPADPGDNPGGEGDSDGDAEGE